MGTCKESSCLWFIASVKMNNITGFILWEYNKKHEYKLINKIVKFTYAGVSTKMKSQVAIMKIDILKNYMQNTFGLKIEKMTSYRARAKASLRYLGIIWKYIRNYFSML